MKHFNAFSLYADGYLNVIKSDCGASKPTSKHSDPKNDDVHNFKAIWDTGATGSVITKKLADEIGILPTGKKDVYHAKGLSKTNTYLVNIHLPNNIRFTGVEVTEGELHTDIEILIGMDIIATGDFAFTNVNGKSCFSFRYPSIKQIDYVKEVKLLSNKSKKPSWFNRGGSYKGKRKKRRK